MNFDLRNKTAVVTGGSGVLGSAFSEALAGAGARVAILSRDVAKSRTVVAKIEAKGGTASALSCDVLDAAAVSRCAEEIFSLYGPCEILVNGAGGNNPKATTIQERLGKDDMERLSSSPAAPDEAVGIPTFFEMDPEGVRWVFDLNFMGTFIPTQVFARQMVGRGGGAIVNIASMGSYAPMTKVPAYCAAKAAVVNFTEWLAVHLAPAGIRANAMAPGFFLGEQNRRLLVDEDGNLTQRGGKIIARTPAGRFGVPEDLVGTLLWLCDSTVSGFVTGTVVPIDGGFNAFTGV